MPRVQGMHTLSTGFRHQINAEPYLTTMQRDVALAAMTIEPDADILGRLVGKYWEALDAMEDLTAHIAGLKDGLEFDLELSIDEHPPEIGTFDCLTTQVELAFVLLEAQRRGLPLTHVAPNFGVEKGVDYGGSDGLEGLEARIRDLVPITQDCGVMIDFHSGDDLGSATRQAIRRATQGQPPLQNLA